VVECAAHMAEEETTTIENETDETAGADETRVYEVGYHILPSVPEENLEDVVAVVRNTIEKAGGSFITEGAPQSIKLAYTMYVNRGGAHEAYDRAYFGWIKFEAEGNAAVELNEFLKTNEQILRYFIFKTVREETRASVKAPKLREVKRTDTIESTPKRGAETPDKSGEVSEEALDKSIEELIGDVEVK